MKKITAECIGTAFLLMAVVGSGIMAETLSGGNISLALLENTIATGAALVALILTFGPISGAHFNPISGNNIQLPFLHHSQVDIFKKSS